MKPQLAEDINRERADALARSQGLWDQPKIDGVRGLNFDGVFTGRSLKKFKGVGITEFWSHGLLAGFDGEMTLGDNPCAARLCSLTTGAMGAFKGVSEMPDLYWWLFDLHHDITKDMPYKDRYTLLEDRVGDVLAHLPEVGKRLRIVPYNVSRSIEALDQRKGHYLDLGYEGLIVRNQNSAPKEGRTTLEGQLWRDKPWADFEIKVTGVTEGAENTNEAKKNELGRTERSSAQEGLVPNGQIGSVQGVLLKDVFDHNGQLLFNAGMEVTAGSGEMTVEEATAWFKDQKQIVGYVAKIKHMTHGVKDLPRFPTFISKRLPEDMSN